MCTIAAGGPQNTVKGKTCAPGVQLQVAFSCVGSQHGIVALAHGPHPREDPDGMCTINVVFMEVLQGGVANYTFLLHTVGMNV